MGRHRFDNEPYNLSEPGDALSLRVQIIERALPL